MDIIAEDMCDDGGSFESVTSRICRMWLSTICRNVTIYYFEQGRDLANNKWVKPKMHSLILKWV